MRALARPVPAALATALLAVPVVLAVVLTGVPAAAPQPIDAGLFGDAGAALLTGRWSSVFADPIVQAGPFELAPWGLARLLGVGGHAGRVLFCTAASTLTALPVALALRTGRGLRSSVLAAAGTLVLCGTGVVTSWTIGYPAEVLIPVCWIAAARLAAADRPVAAAAVVAASTGFEVWGVLGAPVVLLATRVRLPRAALAGLVVLAGIWAPLAAAGPFRMFGYRWPVLPGSLLHLVDPAAATFPWPLRLAQAGLAIGTGTALAALLRRRSPLIGVRLVPAAVVAGRLLVDPVLADYYWSPVEVAAVALLALSAARRDLPLAGASAAMLLVAAPVAPTLPRAAALMTLLIVGGAVLARRATADAASRRGVRAPIPVP